jgi:hypothetical protein
MSKITQIAANVKPTPPRATSSERVALAPRVKTEETYYAGIVGDHLEEVRKYRMKHTRKFRGDLAAICADLRSIQSESGHEVVRLPPRKPGPMNRVAGKQHS